MIRALRPPQKRDFMQSIYNFGSAQNKFNEKIYFKLLAGETSNIFEHFVCTVGVRLTCGGEDGNCFEERRLLENFL